MEVKFILVFREVRPKLHTIAISVLSCRVLPGQSSPTVLGRSHGRLVDTLRFGIEFVMIRGRARVVHSHGLERRLANILGIAYSTYSRKAALGTHEFTMPRIKHPSPIRVIVQPAPARLIE